MNNEEAVKILESIKTDLYDSGVDENNIIFGNDIKAINFAIKVLKERPKGEWKPFVYDYDMPENEHGDHIRPPKEGEEQHWEEYWAPEYYCSICGVKNHKANFCPNCGADMRGAE